ncbi:unannotated protein [freshwater metagenome]|uniref:Unannotated protein n=1 Tax=freshwater metagenome TaxID=449393 RepID=A0A6J6YMY5_9ZZZZ
MRWLSFPTFPREIGDPVRTKFSIVCKPDSLPIGLAPLRHNLIPLYCAGLWLAVNIAPGIFNFPAAKYNISVDARPIRITSKPREVTPAENASANCGEDGRISWPITIVPGSRSCIMNRANAAPVAKVKSGVNSDPTNPRMSYALKIFGTSLEPIRQSLGRNGPQVSSATKRSCSTRTV